MPKPTLKEIQARSASIATSEVRTAEMAALALLGDRRRVVLCKDGAPLAVVVSIEDLMFLLDADLDVAVEEMQDEAEPPPSSGRVKKLEH